MERDYIALGAAKIKLKLRLDRRGHKYEGIKKNNNFNSILLEHGKLIMNKNAFLTGIKYFS